jgi:hypothetical protein
MFFRVESHDDYMQRTVRSEVTVQERQHIVLFSDTTATDLKFCPLCGNPLFPVIDPVTEAQPQALMLGHAESPGRCPGPGRADETDGLR